jgi:hypothetical protein
MRAPLITAVSVAALLTVAGQAQPNRTFVSGQGSDSYPCSLAAPCRSFTGALNQTAAGGEIVVLDSAYHRGQRGAGLNVYRHQRLFSRSLRTSLG